MNGPLILVPKTPKPTSLFRFVDKSIWQIEVMVAAAGTTWPVNGYTDRILENVMTALRKGADEIELVIKLRRAEHDIEERNAIDLGNAEREAAHMRRLQAMKSGDRI